MWKRIWNELYKKIHLFLHRIQFSIVFASFLGTLLAVGSVSFFSYMRFSKEVEVNITQQKSAVVSKAKTSLSIPFDQTRQVMSVLSGALNWTNNSIEDILKSKDTFTQIGIGFLEKSRHVDTIGVATGDGSLLAIERLHGDSLGNLEREMVLKKPKYRLIVVRRFDASGKNAALSIANTAYVADKSISGGHGSLPEAVAAESLGKEYTEEHWFFNDQGIGSGYKKITDAAESVFFDRKSYMVQDVRSRPWYIPAFHQKKEFWTDPYFYINTNIIGVSNAEPLFDQHKNVFGVLFIDMSLQSVTNILRQLVKDHDLDLAILSTPGGNILGSSAWKEDEEMKSLPTFDHIRNAALKSYFSAIMRGDTISGQEIMFNHDGYPSSLYADKIGILSGAQNAWNLTIVIPEKRFLKALSDTITMNLLFGSIIVICSLLINMFIARRISYPIEKLSKILSYLKNGEEMPKIEFGSGFSEVRQMIVAVRKVGRGLQGFMKFIPREVVQKLIRTGQGLKVGAKKREMTVFFTDIRGFTTISEHYPIENLMDHLSSYLDMMTSVIAKHKGSVDKYIGDAVMALFGAPNDDVFHVRHACQAAVECLSHLKHLNAVWKSESKPEFITRFGISAGNMLVGNVGSASRLQYTVIGKNVNLGARLEGLNKYYGTNILLNEYAYKMVQSEFICRPVDLVLVKGTDEDSVLVYELMDEMRQEDDHQYVLEKAGWTTKAWEEYIRRHFEEAHALYKQVFDKYQDTLAGIMMERCAEYIKNPPDESWKGVTKMLQK